MTPSPSGPSGRTSLGFLGIAALALGAGLALAQTPAPAADATAKKPAAKTAAPAAPAARTASYALGLSMGTQLKSNGIGAEDVNAQQLAQGVHDALTGKAAMKDEDQMAIQKLLMSAGQARADANHRIAERFLADNGKKPGVVTTASGLEYKVLTPGSGSPPNPSDEVTVNYRGTLLDGTEFDSSYKRNEPAKFQLNKVIPGWTEGVGLMKPGAKYQLWIPPQLAYDLRSPPGIPPGSLLVFEVELLSTKAAAAAPPAPAK
ncbi:MAG: FKBP-type peptidyl-prolyl cis-trans isomerase [Proteobacteria bacterium]|nr:FKBP-type peptidyl-prolyl cis-trans isomerase [Pseudomonadota bacterium]